MAVRMVAVGARLHGTFIVVTAVSSRLLVWFGSREASVRTPTVWVAPLSVPALAVTRAIRVVSLAPTPMEAVVVPNGKVGVKLAPESVES